MTNVGEQPQQSAPYRDYLAPAQPTQPTRQGPAHPRRLVAAVLCFLAAVLTVVATVVPLFSGELRRGDEAASMTVTGWGFDVTGGAQYGALPTNGIPLVFAAVLLLAAAVAVLVGALSSGTPGAQRVAGLITLAGSAMLFGVAWTVAQQAFSWVDSFGPPDGADLDSMDAEIDSGLGAGLWLLVVAVVLAVVATVLALLPTRRAWNQGWMRPAVDVSTPRYGFPQPSIQPSLAERPTQEVARPAPPAPEPAAMPPAEQSAEQPVPPAAPAPAPPSAEQPAQPPAPPATDQPGDQP